MNSTINQDGSLHPLGCCLGLYRVPWCLLSILPSRRIDNNLCEGRSLAILCGHCERQCGPWGQDCRNRARNEGWHSAGYTSILYGYFLMGFMLSSIFCHGKRIQTYSFSRHYIFLGVYYSSPQHPHSPPQASSQLIAGSTAAYCASRIRASMVLEGQNSRVR